MATIRAYTTIEQSRKLAEILPLESADMYYWCADHYPKEDWIIEVGTPDDNYECICAWSLSALLDIIKSKCGYYELIYLKSTFDRRGDRLENVHRFSVDIYDVYKEEPIDACYEMIIHLHELNL